MNYFAKEFGFNSSQVVALMGVHTLGSAHTNNSGFSVSVYISQLYILPQYVNGTIVPFSSKKSAYSSSDNQTNLKICHE